MGGMDRLTSGTDPNCECSRCTAECVNEWDGLCWVRLAIKRLAAYEDTGLTPGEIAALRAELDAAQRRAEAAVRDLASAALCENCKHVDNDECGETCGDSDSAYRWEWRGPDAPSKEVQP